MPFASILSADSVVRLDGAFDGVAARRLEALLARTQAGARLHIDATQVREFHDFGLAVLATALAQCRALVTLSGLRTHQIRVLRYFGVDTGPLEKAARDAA